MMPPGCLLLGARLTVPLQTSPPTGETAAETLAPQPLVTPSGTCYIMPPMQHFVSDGRICGELPSATPCFRKPLIFPRARCPSPSVRVALLLHARDPRRNRRSLLNRKRPHHLMRRTRPFMTSPRLSQAARPLLFPVMSTQKSMLPC